MKTKLFSVVAVLIYINALGQPVITNAIMPSNGHLMTFQLAQYINPGSAGANQVWNFSALISNSVQNVTTGPPSASPFASSFPAATMQMKTGSHYEFWSVTANDATLEGIVDTSGVQPYNIDPEKLFQYPLKYTDNYNEAANGQFGWYPYGVNTNMFRSTVAQVWYDGFGTLTTPAGTFSNVARIHIVRYVQTLGMHTGVQYDNDEYRWYSDLFHGPLLTIYNDSVTYDQSIVRMKGSKYQSNPGTTVDLKKYTQAAVEVIAFPNPAEDILSIRATSGLMTEVQLVDIHGNVVRQVSSPNGAAFVELGVEELSNGIYLVKVTSNNNGSTNLKAVVNH